MSAWRGIFLMLAGIFFALNVGLIIHYIRSGADAMPIHFVGAGLMLGTMVYIYGGRQS